MNIQEKGRPLADSEKKLYLLGAIVFGGLLLSTIIFGGFFSSLRLLQLRMFIDGTALVYYLAVYFYHQRALKQKQKNLEKNQNEIIIWFNSKELGRK